MCSSLVVAPLLFLTGYAAAARVADVLVVGGSGRVGASTVRWLDKLSCRNGTPLTIAVGGRDAASFERSRARLVQQGMAGADELSFAPIDLDGSAAALSAAVSGASLVVHTAGPFQGREEPSLLRAALGAGVPYCDVCDELLLARNSKALSAEAATAGVPCVVSCGIWPGVSALMAAEAVAKLGGPGSCERIEFSFHTAGTGGAGPTIVSATFLLLATEAMVYVDGKLVAKEPWTERRVSDFGPGIGERGSTFIAPNPSEPARGSKFRYASHNLRFKLNRPNEDRAAFIARISKVEDEPEGPAIDENDGWTFGRNRRDVGSLQIDELTCPASDLARRNLLAVHPVAGWWKTRAVLNSLVVLNSHVAETASDSNRKSAPESVATAPPRA